MNHNIVFLSYNKVVKIMWVEVDGQRRPIMGVEPDGIDEAIVKLQQDLEKEDKQKEEIERLRPKTYSKLKICLGLQNLGKLQDFQTWLSNSDYEFLFTQAQDLSSENEMFSAGVEMVKNALGLTEEEVSLILKNAEMAA